VAEQVQETRHGLLWFKVWNRRLFADNELMALFGWENADMARV
jgi:hypothetical protein